MKIFLTGATGYIGGAVHEALAAAGHAVAGLARSEESAEAVRERGGEAVRGGLRDTDILRAAAAGADGVIHAANTNDEDAGAVDTAATEAILDALAGSGRPFVYTSGIWVLGPTAGRTVDEGASTDHPASLVAWRADLEGRVLASAAEGVRSVVLRPGVVYGRRGGLPAMLVAGDLPLVDGGDQVWPTVHLEDLADLYLRALAAPAASVLHGISGSARPVELVRAAGLEPGAEGAPARVTLAEARETLGPFADALDLDQQIDARRTRELTGWRPLRPSAAETIAAEHRGS